LTVTIRAAGAAPPNMTDASQAALNIRRALHRRLDPRDPVVRKTAAAQLASELFFQPMLAEMRRLPFGKELLDGGRTESVFGAELDRRIADKVAASQGGGIVAQIVQKLGSADESTVNP
jgi:Rod binding domain-containing protein